MHHTEEPVRVAALFPSNVSDQRVLPLTLVDLLPAKGLELFADKGYDSKANRSYIVSLGYKDRIAKRGQRRQHNAGRKRIRVEHSYARIKQFHRLRNRHEKLAISYLSLTQVALVHIISHTISKLGLKV
jgi:IS5 family transposase